MTEVLAEKKCTPCRGGVPPLTQAEAERFQSQTPNWELRDASHRIERAFRLRNFREALNFVRDVGDLAETEGHHPDVSFGCAAHQEDQGIARERFYHGEQD
jgi:4a-hydroxytetrahydrobiopterin dehydratase